MRRIRGLSIAALALLCAAVGPAVYGQSDGPEWIEEGDAGGLPGGAQNTTGEGPMIGIRGELGTGFGQSDNVDMFWIRIRDPEKFFASTTAGQNGFAQFDSALYLFTPAFVRGSGGPTVLGFGLLGNDDEKGNEFGHSTLRQFSTDNSGAFVRDPGLYLLAVTFNFNSPLSKGGDIYRFESQFEISGPDGPGGEDPIIDWLKGEGSGTGQYRIALGGVEFANLPGPGAIGLLAIGGFALRSRRRAC